MAKVEVVAITAPGHEVAMIHEISIYCPKEEFYIIPFGVDTKEMMRTVSALKQRLSEQEKRYDNVLNGLNYFKERTLGKD